MARRMSRFIHFAMARGQGSSRRFGPGLHRLEPRAARSGGGCRQHRRRRHRAGDHRRRGPADQGPGLRSARSPSRRCRLDGRLPAVDGVRPDRSGHHPVGGVRDVDHLLPRRAAHDPARRGRRRAGRRDGGAAAADGLRRAGQHARAVQAQRRAPARVAPVRQGPRRLRLRRGRRRGRHRDRPSTRSNARRHDPGRGRRRGADRRRVPHLGARANRPRRDAWP